MPNINPVSDLRNYGEVLRDVAVGGPVFLSRNGRGRYVILDIAGSDNLRHGKRCLRRQYAPE